MSEQSTSTEWGRVDDDGTVFVRTGEGERAVGTWLAGTPAEGLAHFARRFADLETEVSLLERRVTSRAADAKSLAATVKRLEQTVPEAHAVGDLAGLAARVAAVKVLVGERVARDTAARKEAGDALLAAKTALVDEAERLAQSSEWKASGDRLRTILAEWKPGGVSKSVDEALRKRLNGARRDFERRRGAHFSALDEQRGAAAATKTALVEEAETLASSTEWAATGTRYAVLMTEWKAAGRASKEVDEALWKRFRAAQQAFFDRRSAVHAERDAEFKGNQVLKEALLAEAEALDPGRDLEGAQRALRDIQERWEKAGKVPRDAMAGLDRRLEAAASRVRATADARWQDTNLDSSPFVVRLRESIGKLERKIERAQAAGRTAEVAELEATLATQRSWLPT